MNEFLTEQLVKRKATLNVKLKKFGLIAITVASLFLGFVHYLLVWLTAVLVIADIILLRRMNVEFEYIYFNGDLDVDKIINKQSRKRIFSTKVNDMEVIAPMGAVELQPYQRLKELDFSSQDLDNKVYEMVTLHKGEMVRVLLEPNEKILKGLKSMAPRKVFL